MTGMDTSGKSRLGRARLPLGGAKLSSRVPDARQHEVMRRRSGTHGALACRLMGPGSAVRHFAPHCIRGTRASLYCKMRQRRAIDLDAEAGTIGDAYHAAHMLDRLRQQ